MNSLMDWMVNESPFMAYAVHTQLLDEPGDASAALKDQRIQTIVHRLSSQKSGLPALHTGLVPYTSYGHAFWDLFFLCDIGLSISALGLTNEVESFFSLQDDNGYFVVQNGTKANHVCIPAILLSSLAQMGYRDDARIMRFVDIVKASQRLDGGWHCAHNRAQGNKLQHTDSCPMDTLNILMLLSRFDDCRRDQALQSATDFLLAHWQRKMEPWRPYGFGIGTDFQKLRYPAAKYGILRVLDTLSYYPYAVGQSAFGDMLRHVQAKASDGKYRAESVSRSYAEFDFGQTKAPSTWITFLINRIQKRIDETKNQATDSTKNTGP